MQYVRISITYHYQWLDSILWLNRNASQSSIVTDSNNMWPDLWIAMPDFFQVSGLFQHSSNYAYKSRAKCFLSSILDLLHECCKFTHNWSIRKWSSHKVMLPLVSMQGTSVSQRKSCGTMHMISRKIQNMIKLFWYADIWHKIHIFQVPATCNLCLMGDIQSVVYVIPQEKL